MTDDQVKHALAEREVVALTLFGEIRGGKLEDKVFVGSVIRNRVKTPHRWPDSYIGVCLQPWQFSCWNVGDRNYDAVMTLARSLTGDFHDRPEFTPLLRELYFLADGIVGEQLQDNASRANHYMTRDLWQHNPPSWVQGHQPVSEAGAHVGFFL